MIYKPDQKTMQAFANLKGNQNFKMILLWLADCLARTYEDGSTAKEEYMVRWCQGQSRDLNEILKIAEESKRL